MIDFHHLSNFGYAHVKHLLPPSLALPILPRRRFVQGLAAGGVLLGLSPFARAAGGSFAKTGTGSAAVLTGTEFNLEIGESPVNFTGNPRMATTVNSSLPAPTLKHAEPNMITVNPGQKGGLVWQFPQAGTVDFACLLPGHMEAGMIGKVKVG